MKIWTIGYFPFTLGGDVRRPVASDVPVEGPYDIGKGYQAFVGTSPRGKTFVVESETGAIVGSSLDDVRADIERGDEAVMRQQIEEARAKAARAETMTPDDFWKLLRA